MRCKRKTGGSGGELVPVVVVSVSGSLAAGHALRQAVIEVIGIRCRNPLMPSRVNRLISVIS